MTTERRSPDPATVFRLTADGRRRTVDLLDSLTPEQWLAPTLCTGWSVHVLAAHLTQPLLVSFPRFVVAALRHRGDTGATVDALARRLAAQPRERILGLLREHVDDRLDPRGVGPVGPFADACLHLRDVARPLGLDADVPAETWRALLVGLTAPDAPTAVVPRGRLDGIRIVTSDVDLDLGDGDEVRGPAEAVALAVSGRRVGLAALDGPGVAVLDRRTR